MAQLEQVVPAQTEPWGRVVLQLFAGTHRLYITFGVVEFHDHGSSNVSVSAFPYGTTAAAGVSSAVVTVSGESISAFNFGATATAGVYFYTSSTYQGDVRKRANNAYTLIDNTTDWIRPETEAPGSYRIRYQSMTGDTGFVTNSILATYDGIINGDYIYVVDNTIVFGGHSVTFTIEIDDGTTLQDSGSYTLTADREDF
jgi:hypothetical protein